MLSPNNFAPGQPTNLFNASGQPTLSHNGITYMLMPTDQTQVYLANTINALPQIMPMATTASTTINMDYSVARQSSATSTTAATMPITMNVAEGIVTPNNGNQLLSLKNVRPKSTFVQLSTMVNQKINVSCQKQSFLQSTIIPTTLQETKLKNGKEVSKIPFSMNTGILENFSKPNCLKHEMDNHLFPVLQSSHVNSVSTLKKINQDSSTSHCETLNNESTTEFPKIDDANLNQESRQATKLTTSDDDRTLLSKENTEVFYVSSMLDKICTSIVNETKKRPRGRPRKSLVPPKYKHRRQIPILPATKNIGIKDTKQLSNGNYLIFIRNEKNDKMDTLGIHCEEPKENVSQFETDKGLTFADKDNGSKKKSKKKWLSLRKRKEMQTCLNKEKISITTERVDDETGGNSECYNLSEHCTSSVTCTADIGIETETTNKEKIIIKTEQVDDEARGNSECYNLSEHCMPADIGIETETTNKKKIIKTERVDDEARENSECYNLSEHCMPADIGIETETTNKEKIIKTERVDDEARGNSECYNLSEHCMPSVTCPTDIGIETETTNKEKIIKTERVDDEARGNSEHSNLYETIQEKNTSESELIHTIPEKDEDDDVVISSCYSLSIQSESKRKLLFDAKKSDFDNVPQKTNLENSNIGKKIKRSKCPVTSEQSNSFSDSVVSSYTGKSQILCSKSAENNEIFCDSSMEKDKMKNKTLNEFTLQEMRLTGPCETSLNKSISECEGNGRPVHKMEISVDPFELNESHVESNFRSLPISKDIVLTLHRVQNSLASNKNFVAGSLQSTDNSLICNLTKDKKADAYIEGCITFHEQQIYLLQLQINQHQTALEKLKAAQNCLH